MLPSGTRVLIVEDEPLISMMIEELVIDVGADVAAVARTPDVAVGSIEAFQPDVALLDINLGLITSQEVAEVCRRKGIPVVFISGYTARDLPDFSAETIFRG